MRFWGFCGVADALCFACDPSGKKVEKGIFKSRLQCQQKARGELKG